MKTLALVIPCHNEFHRLRQDAFLKAIDAHGGLSLCFVDDGSTDATAETLAHLANQSPAIHALYLPKNVGKAEAVRTGINYLCANSHADFVGFWDADLATPLDELRDFLRAFSVSPAIVAVIGSRWPHLGASITRTFTRSCTGTIMKFLLHLVLRAPVYDTQCGAKLFTRDLAHEIFADAFSTHWLFDVELLWRIGPARLRANTYELPLQHWRDVPGSKLSGRDSIRIFGELIKLARTIPRSWDKKNLSI